MKNKSLHFLLLGFLVLGLMLGSYQGVWKQGAKKVITSKISPKNKIEEAKDIYLEVIWDASGSMWGKECGVEKIIRSKDVLKSLTQNIPASINIGLRIFGARRVGDLKDSFLAVPFKEKNRADIINFITNVKPLGKSPIGYSLSEAEKDLKTAEGKKCILLVSDGIANGNLPPGDVVNSLVQNNIILHVVYVGDSNNKDLKTRLKKIAKMTGGNYFIYKNSGQIVSVFNRY